jgi:hypothetical protein
MTITRIQLRGNCQCCGRDQAVLQPSGRMSKHGYEVSEYHFFRGVCQGERYLPIQQERTMADSIVVAVRADVQRNLDNLAKLKAGKIKPEQARTGKRVVNPAVRTGYRMMDEMVPFADAELHYQRQAIERLEHQFEQQARMGTHWADDFELLVNLKHGEPLAQVEVEAPPARIERGEQRNAGPGRLLVAEYQDGANVRYTVTNSAGKVFKGKIGVQAWRRLPVAS